MSGSQRNVTGPLITNQWKMDALAPRNAIAKRSRMPKEAGSAGNTPACRVHVPHHYFPSLRWVCACFDARRHTAGGSCTACQPVPAVHCFAAVCDHPSAERLGRVCSSETSTDPLPGSPGRSRGSRGAPDVCAGKGTGQQGMMMNERFTRSTRTASAFSTVSR